MTRTHDALGTSIDTDSTISTNLEEERKAVLRREAEARDVEESALVQELAWERAIMDLNVPAQKHYSLFCGSEFEAYAEFYGLDGNTVAYARERARETSNLLLRVHHLEYVLARGPQTGKEWFATQRQLAEAYRELIDTSRPVASSRPCPAGGVTIELDT